MKARIELNAIDRAYFALRADVKGSLKFRNIGDSKLRSAWRNELRLNLAAIREIKLARMEAMGL